MIIPARFKDVKSLGFRPGLFVFGRQGSRGGTVVTPRPATVRVMPQHSQARGFHKICFNKHG